MTTIKFRGGVVGNKKITMDVNNKGVKEIPPCLEARLSGIEGAVLKIEQTFKRQEEEENAKWRSDQEKEKLSCAKWDGRTQGVATIIGIYLLFKIVWAILHFAG